MPEVIAAVASIIAAIAATMALISSRANGRLLAKLLDDLEEELPVYGSLAAAAPVLATGKTI